MDNLYEYIDYQFYVYGKHYRFYSVKVPDTLSVLIVFPLEFIA